MYREVIDTNGVTHYYGVLNDFDLARCLTLTPEPLADSIPLAPRFRSGNPIYCAVRRLNKNPPLDSLIHDLESFFYCYLLAISCDIHGDMFMRAPPRVIEWLSCPERDILYKEKAAFWFDVGGIADAHESTGTDGGMASQTAGAATTEAAKAAGATGTTEEAAADATSSATAPDFSSLGIPLSGGYRFPRFQTVFERWMLRQRKFVSDTRPDEECHAFFTEVLDMMTDAFGPYEQSTYQ